MENFSVKAVELASYDYIPHEGYTYYFSVISQKIKSINGTVTTPVFQPYTVVISFDGIESKPNHITYTHDEYEDDIYGITSTLIIKVEANTIKNLGGNPIKNIKVEVIQDQTNKKEELLMPTVQECLEVLPVSKRLVWGNFNKPLEENPTFYYHFRDQTPTEPIDSFDIQFDVNFLYNDTTAYPYQKYEVEIWVKNKYTYADILPDKISSQYRILAKLPPISKDYFYYHPSVGVGGLDYRSVMNDYKLVYLYNTPTPSPSSAGLVAGTKLYRIDVKFEASPHHQGQPNLSMFKWSGLEVKIGLTITTR